MYRPTVYGSLDTYAMTIYSKNLSIKYFDGEGLDWNFATFNSETLLSEFVVDMYKQKRPFIANDHQVVRLTQVMSSIFTPVFWREQLR